MRVGYEVIVAFVGDFNATNALSPRLQLTRKYLLETGAAIFDFQCDASYSIKMSQILRIFGGFLPENLVLDTDYIITADSDLFPLNPAQYTPSTEHSGGFITNAFCCGSFNRRSKSYRMFPMGHIYLSKRIWRAIWSESVQNKELLNILTSDPNNRTTNFSYEQQLLKIYPNLNQTLSHSDMPTLTFDLVSLYMRHEFRGVYDQQMGKGDAAWYMDQIMVSMLLGDYRDRHKNFSIHERDRGQRLDRADALNFWDRSNFSQFGDSHLKHDEILEDHTWAIF
ncbi:unnamed protein product, partial [Didymodactylos carnosus]